MYTPIAPTPIMSMCSGKIINRIAGTNTYEVNIHQSPVGPMEGLSCGAICPAGLGDNYKVGDMVKVAIKCMHSSSEGKALEISKDGIPEIVGLFKERSVTGEITVENPLTRRDPDNTTFINPVSNAGVVTTDTGEVRTVGGAVFTSIKPFGNGLAENESRTQAQNHHRIVSALEPYYFVKEYFGMFAGKSEEDKTTRVAGKDNPINYKRFVAQCLGIENWVSTCEGAWNPWVGPNNDSEVPAIHKEVLSTKIINHGKSRITIELGEPGASFINLRVDSFLLPERKSTSDIGANTITPGGMFKFQVSDKGEVVMMAAGSGTFPTNSPKFKMTISAAGDITFNAAGKITLTHGDGDVAANSIVLDPTKGVDISASKGFRVNGDPLITKKFLDWFDTNKLALCQTIALGAPSPISEIAKPTLALGVGTDQATGAFSTINQNGVPAVATITMQDAFESV